MRFLLLLGAFTCLSAQPADPWKPLQFLTGDWVGDGNGACSFNLDLQRKVMIRKSYATYPTFRHDDLMVVYLDPASKGMKAIYFDSEGHTIHYIVDAGADSVRFLSEPTSGEPGYRLTYRKTGDRELSLDFDIAPPGKQFASYIHALLHHK